MATRTKTTAPRKQAAAPRKTATAKTGRDPEGDRDRRQAPPSPYRRSRFWPRPRPRPRRRIRPRMTGRGAAISSMRWARSPMRRADLKVVMELVLEEMGKLLDTGDELVLPPLGKLIVKKRVARPGGGDMLTVKLQASGARAMGMAGTGPARPPERSRREEPISPLAKRARDG
jgi:hypothetical protein